MNVAQPQPYRPGWSVTTFTTTSRMRLGAVRTIWMSLMRIAGRPLGAGGTAGEAGAACPAASPETPVNSPAPAA